MLCPYELLLDWASEIIGRGRSKYNIPCDTFLSYNRECALCMLLRAFWCFMYTPLYPSHSMLPFLQVIDVQKDPLAVSFCLSMYLCGREFNRILEFLQIVCEGTRPSEVPKMTGQSK